MLKGIYSAAAGMSSQMIMTDIGANNLANVNTAGFKEIKTDFKTFGEMLVKRIGNNQQVKLGNFAHGSQVLASVTDFTQGDLIQTGNPLDMGLKGDGFFSVRVLGNDAVVYTRCGSFTRDNEGFITTINGDRLQGYNGDILIPRNAKKITISKSGEIIADDKIIDTLKIAQFKNNQELKRIGASYYKILAQPENDVTGVTVEQGSLERSNANVITEMVNSMTGLRIYETLQKSIQMQNETLGKAVNDVGRVT